MEVLKIVSYLLKIILSFLAEPGLTRKPVFTFVRPSKDFLKTVFSPQIKSDILNSLEYPDPRQKIQGYFKRYENLFDYVDTETKITALLMRSGYKEPEPLTLGFVFDENWEPREFFMSYLRLRDSLKGFLKLPGMFNKIMSYLEFLENDNSEFIYNIVQGTMWKTKYKTSNKIILPLFFYFDEFEAGNPLGSHAGVNKLGAMYASIACLPPDIASKLTSIFFIGLVCAKDIKSLKDNSKVFSEIIHEFNYLSKYGIKIVVDKKLTTIYFQLALILGDNLGLNQIFDFVPSFRDTTFCRICRSHPSEWKFMVEEQEDLLRTKQNYERDLALPNSKDWGIVGDCAFNSVKNFHIMENVRKRHYA